MPSQKIIKVLCRQKDQDALNRRKRQRKYRKLTETFTEVETC